MDPFTICISIVVSLILFICWAPITSKDSKNLPPGPPKLPIIGNIHQLEKRAPHRKLNKLARIYGPIMHLQLGQLSTVIISSPQLAQEVLKNQDLSFSDRPSNTTSQIFFYNSTNIAFSSYGNYWRQIKKIATLELLSAKKVRSFFYIKEDEINQVFKFLDSSSGTPINFRDMTSQTVNNIISRCLLGDVCEERNFLVDSAFYMLKTFNAFNLFNYFPSLKFFNVISGKKAEWMKVHVKVDVILEKILREHRSRPRGSQDHEDLLDVLLRVKDSSNLDFPITDDNIKAVVLEMLTAGTSSSSMSIEWAFCEMMRNPRIMKKAQSEVRSVVKGSKITEADIQSMHYLKLVIKETMRLHAVPILLPRMSHVDSVVGGYDIPAETRVLINAWACGTDPGSWENPNTFIPERFENSSISPAGNDFEYLPFGAGRRMCPGMNFGIGSVEYILANLLHHCDWKLPDGVKPHDIDMTEVTGISTLPINPLHIVPIPISKSN